MICTGANTFFGRAASLVGQDDDSTGHLQRILAQIDSFCLVSIGIFVIAEIFVLYAGFRYEYRRGLNNIGGIPIAMPTVLSVTLAVGAQQLSKHKVIVTRITAIEDLDTKQTIDDVMALGVKVKMDSRNRHFSHFTTRSSHIRWSYGPWSLERHPQRSSVVSSTC